jgi:hypothetical protein
MQHPTGVRILAIAMLLGIPYLLVAALAFVGVGGFLGGIPILLMSFLSMFVDWPSHALLVFFLQFRFAPSAAVFIGFYCFLMLIYLALGVGLLRLQNWARFVVVVLAILNLLAGVVGYASPRLLLLRQSIISLAIEVVVLIYLFRPELKEAFGLRGAGRG